MTQVLARPANWLPLPQIGLAKKVAETVVDENDFFPKGEVISFYPRQGYGYVKNNQGHEILFRLEELDLVGPKADANNIAVGSRVGYDVSWTSSGLHICTLKIY